MKLQTISSIRLSVVAVFAAITLTSATALSAEKAAEKTAERATEDSPHNRTTEENQPPRTDENNARDEDERKRIERNENQSSYGRGFESRQGETSDTGQRQGHKGGADSGR